MQAIREWHNVTEKLLKDQIIPLYCPAILKGFVSHWPVVKKYHQQNPAEICNYLMALDNGFLVDAVMTPPECKGRVGYLEETGELNFYRKKLPVSAVIQQISRYSQFATPPSVAVQSALIGQCLPGFSEDNPLPVFLNGSAPEARSEIAPRIWIGNEFITPAHVDESDNLACVVYGARRFTLFPPDQVGNLYIGPLDYAPTRSPISMVDFKAPDFERFPRFEQALQMAQVATLEPGDAIYIPGLWWHHVESLRSLNILVNYWWSHSGVSENPVESPFDCMVHCLKNMQHLPPEHKAAWEAMFRHYVFNAKDDLLAHIHPERHGILKKSQ